MSATSFAVACVLLLCLLIAPAAAFGAGDITHSEGLDGHLWRHGDIATAVLLNLPISFKTKHRFSELEKRTVYFGNWLRDFSQIVDVTALKVMPEPLLRAMVSRSMYHESDISVLRGKGFSSCLHAFWLRHG